MDIQHSGKFSQNTIANVNQAILEKYEEWKPTIEKEIKEKAARDAKGEASQKLWPTVIGWIAWFFSIGLILQTLKNTYTPSVAFTVMGLAIGIGYVTSKIIRMLAAVNLECNLLTAAHKEEANIAAKVKPVGITAVSAETLKIKPSSATMITIPVKDPIQHEVAVGVVTHYFSNLHTAIIVLNTGALKIGDAIRIKGATTDFTQTLEYMEFDHQSVQQVTAGQSIGLRVKGHIERQAVVYLQK